MTETCKQVATLRYKYEVGFTPMGESPRDSDIRDWIKRKALPVPGGPQPLAPLMFDGRRMPGDNWAMGSSMGQVLPVLYSFFGFSILFCTLIQFEQGMKYV
ncbi:hypothetical protein Fot_03330 [Forsythia ovata]|uniref:Uncharacterized protein n=1 Tax=Forsythia ovata TaxID=205694 RepID=A0ABD1XA11_9LAMI